MDLLVDLGHSKGYEFYDLGCTSDKPGMLIWDETHLTKRSKNILGKKLALFITRTLNYNCVGKGVYC